MSSLLGLILIVVAVIAVMTIWRRYVTKKAEAEMREAAVLQDSVLEGTKNMRGHIKDMTVTEVRRKPKLQVVDKNDSDDLAVLNAAHLGALNTSTNLDSQDTPAASTDDDLKRKVVGGGGTFDGGGSSADWKHPEVPKTPQPYRSSDWDEPRTRTFDSTPSSDDTNRSSGSSDSSSSGSSDSGSSSSSSSND